MGYEYYLNHAGRECGYGVRATCDHPGCKATVDRGLAYLCGGTDAIHGRGVGCGGYFCATHLPGSREIEGGRYALICKACTDAEGGGRDG